MTSISSPIPATATATRPLLPSFLKPQFDTHIEYEKVVPFCAAAAAICSTLTIQSIPIQIIQLFTRRRTATMYDRQAAVLDKLSKAFENGMVS
jgi:hypothetical protein